MREGIREGVGDVRTEHGGEVGVLECASHWFVVGRWNPRLCYT